MRSSLAKPVEKTMHMRLVQVSKANGPFEIM